MAWDSRINPVLEALVKVIGDIQEIRMIATRAGLNLDKLSLSSGAADLWTKVLECAQDMGDDHIDAVLETALRTYDNSTLRDAIEAYWREIGRSQTATQPDSLRRAQVRRRSKRYRHQRP